jgi:hypothetical protein
MKRSNRCTLVLFVGGGVAALAAAGLLARPSGATVADTTCPADMTAILKNLSPPTVPIGVSVVRSFTLPSSWAVSAVHLSAPDGYNATQLEAKDGAYGLQLTAPRAGAFTIQATWSEFYMVDNGDGTNAGATCSGAGSVTLTAVRPTAAAPANRNLPAEGIWSYDNIATVKSAEGNAIFNAYLRVIPGKSNIYSLKGAVLGGTCKRKDGRTLPAGGIAYSAVRTLISVKPDGSFSATRNALGDAAGAKGTVTVKGVFDGTHVSGTITAHMHNLVYGDCKGTGKFFRAKGVQIG